MKKMIALVVGAIFLFSCQKDELVNSNNSGPKTGIPILPAYDNMERPIICDSWHISSFILDSKEIASEFDAYNLLLCSGNLVSAVSDKFNVPGKWVYESKIGYPILSLSFDLGGDVNGPVRDARIELLNESWSVVEETDLIMRLKAVSFKTTKSLLLKKIY